MKFDDGPTAQVDVLISAPIERVWQLATDIDLPGRFSSELVEACWLDGPPAVGARFRGRNRHHARGEWETISFVNRYEPPHRFGWAVTDPGNPSACWWFEMEKEGFSVRLRHGTQLGPGPSRLTELITVMPDKEERIIARRLAEHEANMRATVNGIKRLAEEGR